jgi:RNA 2',3'-cyclic 3'-phosphodiesterase
MPRLFVAVDFPETHLDAVSRLNDDSVDARWTPPAQLHLTLRFLGDVPARDVGDIHSALSAIRSRAFSLVAGGLDVFPSRRSPRVLVIQVEHEQRLLELQQRVDEALQNLGVEPDSRPYSPHITFARLKAASPRQIRKFLRAHADFTLSPFEVTSFHLYESILQPSGAVHNRVESYPLTGA